MDNNYGTGIDMVVGDDSGHAWIIDGYVDNQYKYINVYAREGMPNPPDPFYFPNPPIRPGEPDPIYGTNVKVTEEYHVQSYWKMNFGWDGDEDDGMYSTYSDQVWQAGSHPYRYHKSIIYKQ